MKGSRPKLKPIKCSQCSVTFDSIHTFGICQSCQILMRQERCGGCGKPLMKVQEDGSNVPSPDLVAFGVYNRNWHKRCLIIMHPSWKDPALSKKSQNTNYSLEKGFLQGESRNTASVSDVYDTYSKMYDVVIDSNQPNELVLRANLVGAGVVEVSSTQAEVPSGIVYPVNVNIRPPPSYPPYGPTPHLVLYDPLTAPSAPFRSLSLEGILLRAQAMGMVRERNLRFRAYQYTIIARELVSFMLSTCQFRSREEAIEAGRLMEQEGLLQNIAAPQSVPAFALTFEDNDALFSVVTPRKQPREFSGAPSSSLAHARPRSTVPRVDSSAQLPQAHSLVPAAPGLVSPSGSLSLAQPFGLGSAELTPDSHPLVLAEEFQSSGGGESGQLRASEPAPAPAPQLSRSTVSFDGTESDAGSAPGSFSAASPPPQSTQSVQNNNNNGQSNGTNLSLTQSLPPSQPQASVANGLQSSVISTPSRPSVLSRFSRAVSVRGVDFTLSPAASAPSQQDLSDPSKLEEFEGLEGVEEDPFSPILASSPGQPASIRLELLPHVLNSAAIALILSQRSLAGLHSAVPPGLQLGASMAALGLQQFVAPDIVALARASVSVSNITGSVGVTVLPVPAVGQLPSSNSIGSGAAQSAGVTTATLASLVASIARTTNENVGALTVEQLIMLVATKPKLYQHLRGFFLQRYTELQAKFISSGWLVKQGHVVQSWKRRFFILRGFQLSYFKDIPSKFVAASASSPSSSNGSASNTTMPGDYGTPQGVLNMRDYSLEKAIVSRSSLCMRLAAKSNEKVEYLMFAESEIDFVKWVKVLSSTIKLWETMSRAASLLRYIREVVFVKPASLN